MSEEYAKLASRIVYSSLWEEDAETCKVFVTMLALKDRNGIVDKNITGISRLSKVPLAKCEEAIAKFEAPDPRSGSTKEEGRRLRKVPQGWQFINHEEYQEYGWSDNKKIYERKRKSDYRAKEEQPASADAGIPTFEEVKAEAEIRGVILQSAKGFFEHYTGKNLWLNQYGRMIDWRKELVFWANRDREKGHNYGTQGKGFGGSGVKELSAKKQRAAGESGWGSGGNSSPS